MVCERTTVRGLHRHCKTAVFYGREPEWGKQICVSRTPICLLSAFFGLRTRSRTSRDYVVVLRPLLPAQGRWNALA
jgi:hypothetical protein